jgi:CRISPR-associated protein Cmr4
MSTARLLFVHVLSPLHAGTGQSVGAIDLAVARDKATSLPYVPGSSLKGTLRDVAHERWGGSTTPRVRDAFGPYTPAGEDARDQAGVLAFGDANLLLLPVRSIAGTFAWVTSPYVLARFARDAAEAGLKMPWRPAVGKVGQCIVAADSPLRTRIGGKERVVFEDLDFEPVAESQNVGVLAQWLGARLFPDDGDWQRMLRERLCVVHDDAMSFFAQHGTDVVARVALDDDRKTVRKGQLWYEESLPTETVLCALVGATLVKAATASPAEALKGLSELAAEQVQLGGKAGIGRGRCRLVVAGGDA